MQRRYLRTTPRTRQPGDRRGAGLKIVSLLAVGVLTTLGLVLSRDRAESLVVAPTQAFDPGSVECPGDCDYEVGALPLLATLGSGETLDELLSGLGLPAEDRIAIVTALSEHVEIRRLRPGLEVLAYIEEMQAKQLRVLVPRKGRVHLDGTNDGWEARWAPFVESYTTHQVAGTIDGSLVGSLSGAGAPTDLAYRMADVLRWDVDFNRDLRNGDRFEVVWEEVFLDGVRDRTGSVVALAFWNRGRRLEAYRHEDGYYDAEGRPLQKMFLRSPLPFTRVTSRFSHRRFHPVLKTYRPHYGVDYGAPTGTPVRATAAGVVSFAAWGKGAGRMVKIDHPNGYLTAYLHLSKFGSGVRPGRRVRQGDVIGYVGSSGLSTGPHLDYRVQLKGRWIDPLSIKAVPADPISAEGMTEFLALRDELRGQLSPDRIWDGSGTELDPGQDRIATAESVSPRGPAR